MSIVKKKNFLTKCFRMTKQTYLGEQKQGRHGRIKIIWRNTFPTVNTVDTEFVLIFEKSEIIDATYVQD